MNNKNINPTGTNATLTDSLANLTLAVDASTDICARLLQPMLTALPAILDLRGMLSAPLPVRLPVFDWLYTQFIRDALLVPAAAHLEPESLSHAQALSARLSGCLLWDWVPGNEQHTMLAVEALLISPLMSIDKFAPRGAKLSLVKQRDTSDSSSGMTSLSTKGQPQRPDLQLRSSDGMRLLFKGEDKVEDLAKAVKDLCNKMAPVWSPLLYGTLPYLLCYAAAGSKVQLYAMPRDNSHALVAISDVFDMSQIGDRVSLLCVAVQLHRLLQAVNACLPDYVLPMDRDLVHIHKRSDETVAWTRTVTLESATMTAKKTVIGWSALCEEVGTSLEVVKAAYECPAPLGGIVRAVKGPHVTKDTYVVRLKPIGLPGTHAEPQSERELSAAAHGLLHGLAALHAAGLVHRDVRWVNVARTEECRYFLIDLEACARQGSVPACTLSCWHSHTLDGALGGPALFTSASDVHLLGHLLADAAKRLRDPLSEAGQSFLERLLHREAGARPSATDALADPWVACVGNACMEAGARA